MNVERWGTGKGGKNRHRQEMTWGKTYFSSGGTDRIVDLDFPAHGEGVSICTIFTPRGLTT